MLVHFLYKYLIEELLKVSASLLVASSVPKHFKQSILQIKDAPLFAKQKNCMFNISVISLCGITYI
jgi:hypothetical protein